MCVCVWCPVKFGREFCNLDLLFFFCLSLAGIQMEGRSSVEYGTGVAIETTEGGHIAELLGLRLVGRFLPISDSLGVKLSKLVGSCRHPYSWSSRSVLQRNPNFEVLAEEFAK